MLKPRHRLRHERRVLVQIPVGVVKMSVPKICGQRRQPALGVCAGSIASTQDLDRHGVPQIMQSRPRRIRETANAELPAQSQERPIQNGVCNPTAERRYEEGLDDFTRQELITALPIDFQDVTGRRMHRDQPGFSELRVAYGYNPAIEIDVFEIKKFRTSLTRIPVTLSRPKIV